MSSPILCKNTHTKKPIQKTHFLQRCRTVYRSSVGYSPATSKSQCRTTITGVIYWVVFSVGEKIKKMWKVEKIWGGRTILILFSHISFPRGFAPILVLGNNLISMEVPLFCQGFKGFTILNKAYLWRQLWQIILRMFQMSNINPLLTSMCRIPDRAHPLNLFSTLSLYQAK